MPAGATATLPATPRSVVWSGGHPLVSDGNAGERWVGLDDAGSAVILTRNEMASRAWTVVHSADGQPTWRTSTLPATPCSVVWLDGHPFVLDGEPGVPTTRRWIGLDDAGSAVVLTRDEMATRAWKAIYVDAGTI